MRCHLSNIGVDIAKAHILDDWYEKSFNRRKLLDEKIYEVLCNN